MQRRELESEILVFVTAAQREWGDVSDHIHEVGQAERDQAAQRPVVGNTLPLGTNCLGHTYAPRGDSRRDAP